MEYGIDQFVEQAQTVASDRPFDKYILPAFMLWYAWRSKQGMGRWSRRILFTAGVYAVYRNLTAYRDAINVARAAITQSEGQHEEGQTEASVPSAV